jgi:hypothetical protein
MTYSPGEVADRLEIQDQIALYCHAFDAFDWDALDEVFAPECTFDFSRLGSGTRDWTFMKQYFAKKHIPPHDLHIYANPLIRFNADRTEATSICKVYNPQGVIKKGELHLFALHGNYHDRWAKKANGWRIVGRQWELAFIMGDYPFDSPPGASIPQPGEL